MSGDRQT